jgi:deazaflavin-dependent oxidoreductase (nitroreductase family)
MSNDFMPPWERYFGHPMLKLHDTIYQKTNGWVGHRIPFTAPILMLHTVGAKTGIHRTNSLSYAKDGDSYLVVASMGGAPKSPGWYFNVKANPNVEINVGPKRMPAVARIIGDDDPDYPRLWKLVNDNNNDVYNGYQTRTTRPIPLVALTP